MSSGTLISLDNQHSCCEPILRGNPVFVRIFVFLCHPEVIPKDLLVQNCQAKILRCAQNDKTFFSHCEPPLRGNPVFVRIFVFFLSS
jgi:hypothetical protein